MNFYVGVPFSGCEEHIGDKYLVATREDEAIAIAVGAWFAGKDTLVFMQDSGIGNSLDILTSLLIPYGIQIDILIGHRKTPEHHRVMGEKSELMLKLVGYETIRYC